MGQTTLKMRDLERRESWADGPSAGTLGCLEVQRTVAMTGHLWQLVRSWGRTPCLRVHRNRGGGSGVLVATLPEVRN